MTWHYIIPSRWCCCVRCFPAPWVCFFSLHPSCSFGLNAKREVKCLQGGKMKDDRDVLSGGPFQKCSTSLSVWITFRYNKDYAEGCSQHGLLWDPEHFPQRCAELLVFFFYGFIAVCLITAFFPSSSILEPRNKHFLHSSIYHTTPSVMLLALLINRSFPCVLVLW